MVRKIIGTSSLSGTYSLKTTIHKDVVKALKLQAGDKIVFIQEDSRVYIEKA